MEIPYKKHAYCMRWTIAFSVGIGVLIFIIVIIASEDDTDSWKGKWLNVDKGDDGSFVCTKAVGNLACPTTWSKLGGKCFKYVSRKMKRDQANTYCGTLSVGASLAKIESAAEDKFAFDMCKDSDGHLCLLGLKIIGSDMAKDKWKYMDNTAATFTNWWETEDHTEPTDEKNETTVSWMNGKLLDEIKGAVFIAFIIVVVWMLLLIFFCSVNSLFFHMGITKRNKCCVCTSISLDGVATGLCVLGLAGAVMREDWGNAISNLILGGFFLTASILGCMLCNKVEGSGAGGGPVQQEAVVVGQPIEVLGGNDQK